MNVTNPSTPLNVADTARSFIRWGLYPLLWIWVVGCVAYCTEVLGFMAVGTVVVAVQLRPNEQVVQPAHPHVEVQMTHDPVVPDDGAEYIGFGTFHYRPGVPPAELGLSIDDGYPGQHDPLRAALFPFSTQAVSGERTVVAN